MHKITIFVGLELAMGSDLTSEVTKGKSQANANKTKNSIAHSCTTHVRQTINLTRTEKNTHNSHTVRKRHYMHVTCVGLCF